MTFTGRYIDGQIVPDVPLALPEGAPVRCDVAVATPVAEKPTDEADYSKSSGTKLRDRLKNFLKHQIDDLPPDAAENHDHYLYDRPLQ